MWNLSGTVRASGCRGSLQGHGGGCPAGLVLQCSVWIRIAAWAQEQCMERHWDALWWVWNCKEKDLESERVWVTAILFWVLFSWCNREKAKLTGSWAAVFYIFLWWCLFDFVVVFSVVRLLSHLHTHQVMLEDNPGADLLHTGSSKCELLQINHDLLFFMVGWHQAYLHVCS